MHEACYERQARICQVLADPKRLRLLDLLRRGERSVGELAGALGASYPNVSQHLTVMREAGLVTTRRAGTTVYYRLAFPQLAEACDIVHGILLAQDLCRTAQAERGVDPAGRLPAASRQSIPEGEL